MISCGFHQVAAASLDAVVLILQCLHILMILNNIVQPSNSVVVRNVTVEGCRYRFCHDWE